MKKLLFIAIYSAAILARISTAYCVPAHHVSKVPSAPQPASKTAPLTTEQITANTLPSVVSLTVKDANGSIIKTGSGVVIGVNAVATCYHVIDGASTITVNFSDGRSVTAYGISSANKALDVAILGADTHGFNGPTLEFKVPGLGASVIAIGNPEGLNGSVSTGIISGVRNDGNRTLIQTTAPISPGSSGGALVDSQGQLVGITSNYIPDGENLNFAISIMDVGSVAIGTTASFADLKSALVPSTTQPTSSSPLAYTSKPLAGVGGVSVLIEDISQDAISDGLSKDVISDDVQLELHKDGIPFDATDEDDQAGHGYFYVQQTMLKLSNGDYAYSINVQFNEKTTLMRNVPVQAITTTWSDIVIGYISSDEMVSTIRQTTSDEVDKFATDYLAQNPKQ